MGASYRGSSRSISFQRIWRRRICRLENVIRGPSRGRERLLQDDRSETVPRKCLSILHVHSQSSADLPRRRWERLITIESIERVYAQCCSNPNFECKETIDWEWSLRVQQCVLVSPDLG